MRASPRPSAAAWPARLPSRDLLGTPELEAVFAEPLLGALLASIQIWDIELERFLTGLRSDLSLASLGYAARKSRELGLDNIAHAQADILELGSIGRSFDIIESSGVLHHLADWRAGWRVLLTLLRPGGLMRLGFWRDTGPGSPMTRARPILRAGTFSRRRIPARSGACTCSGSSAAEGERVTTGLAQPLNRAPRGRRR
jgi:SAM-dependent methyltransferase